MRASTTLHDEYNVEAERLRSRLGRLLRDAMSTMVGSRETADIVLVAADGKKLPAHLSILRRRAPFFCQRYIEPTLRAAPTPTRGDRGGGSPIEVAIGDVDSTGLQFFVRSTYTDEELAKLPHDGFRTRVDNDDDNENDKDDDDPDNADDGDRIGGSRRSSSAAQNYDSSSTTKYRDGLHDETIGSSGGGGGETINENTPSNTRRHNETNSQSASTTRLCDLTNCEPIVSASSSFASRNELQVASAIGGGDGEDEGLKTPLMTSFAELASIASNDDLNETRRRSRSVTSEMAVVIQPPTSRSSSRAESARYQKTASCLSTTWFIDYGDNDDTASGGGGGGDGEIDESMMTQSAPSTSNIRSRALLARRLSVSSSLTSLASIDVPPTLEGTLPIADDRPANALGADLLALYLDSVDTDCTIRVRDDADGLRAHRVVLYATCTTLRPQLQSTNAIIDLTSYARSTVHAMLCCMYGGVTSIGDAIDVFEFVALVDALFGFSSQSTTTRLHFALIEVAILHLRAYTCHFFHRPCAACVSAIFDALPRLHAFDALRQLFDEAMAWQARHFARVWKSRVFQHTSSALQRECFGALIGSVNEENVIDVILQCEKLTTTLPRQKSQHASSFVQRLVGDASEFVLEFLVATFDGLIASESFVSQGKSLALNLPLLEDLLPTLVHSLSPDTAIRTLICLKSLLIEAKAAAIDDSTPRKLRDSNISLTLGTDEAFNPRFVALCGRLLDLTDKHILQHASAVTRAAAWPLLGADEQKNVMENGLFVEMRLPKALPPRFSSLGRTYKRSASVGIDRQRRGGSLERARPSAAAAFVGDAADKLEVIMEREKSQTQIPLSHRPATAETVIVTPPPSRSPIASPKVTTHPTSLNSSNSRSATPTTASTLTVDSPKLRAPSPARVNTKRAAKMPPPPLDGQPPLSTTLRSEGRRSPSTAMSSSARRQPPAAAVARPLLEREQTHTIMTAAQMSERHVDATRLPTVDTPTVAVDDKTTTVEAPKSKKPRSVVAPMPKAPVVASTPTAARRVAASNTRPPPQKTRTAPIATSTSSKSTRSALPTRRAAPDNVAAATPLSIDRRLRDLPRSTGESRAPPTAVVSTVARPRRS